MTFDFLWFLMDFGLSWFAVEQFLSLEQVEVLFLAFLCFPTHFLKEDCYFEQLGFLIVKIKTAAAVLTFLKFEYLIKLYRMFGKKHFFACFCVFSLGKKKLLITLLYEVCVFFYCRRCLLCCMNGFFTAKDAYFAVWMGFFTAENAYFAVWMFFYCRRCLLCCMNVFVYSRRCRTKYKALKPEVTDALNKMKVMSLLLTY